MLFKQHIEREYVRPAEAEALTGVSRWTWRRRCYEGSISSVKCGRSLLIPVAEIRRVIAEGTRPALRDRL